MNPQKWQQIEDIFQGALDLAAGERERFIAERCGADDELRREVERLVARAEKDETFLESPVWTDSLLLQTNAKREIAASLDEELPEQSGKSMVGERVGAYRLTKELGRGGMGVVYLAERADGEFRQKTAVKLIKRGMDSDFIVKRFRHERQILADLNHPNIARLVDGGTTYHGSPYFVMEYIEGAPLLKYAAEKSLDLGARLEIFLSICRAVAYAHRQKIIHRDIKPSNILVTRDGAPKLLDFGIAKLLDAESIHDSLLPTATAMRLMTPEYASPEQARGEEITPATDQYSLGVLLYELLTGKRPYKFTSRAPHEIARVICEEIPSAPSLQDFENDSTLKDKFLTDPDFCRELDRMVLKALRKQPSERYGSVEDFADDIERFLRGERVRAESFTTGERENGLPETAFEHQPTAFENALQTQPRTAAAKPPERIVKPVITKSSPRAKGVKQGAFITVSSIILLPVLMLLTLTGVIELPFAALVFALLFFGGFVRIVYALLLEAGKKQIEAEETLSIAEAETKLIYSEPPRETVSFQQTTGENKQTTGESSAAAVEKSIAVLPFRSLNALTGETTEETEFLGIGLVDALITRLSNIPQLAVRPTSSVLRFDRANDDSFAAGRELNVDFVLEGRILKIERKLRVSVQLLDVGAENTVWAERFDEDLTDVLSLEDSISNRVAESLSPQLSANEAHNLTKRPTDNAKAFEAYLRGRFHWNNFTQDSFRQSISYYRRAIDFDPDFALAYAGIADYHIWLGVYGVLPTAEFYPAARDAARRAIALDPNLSEAHAALGLARLYGEYDWEASESDLRRAVTLNPNNSVAHLWFSHVLFSQKRFAEGRRHLDRALRLDPLSFQPQNTLAWSYYFSRRHEQALAEADRLVERFPAVEQAHFSRVCFLNHAGRIDEATGQMKRAAQISNDDFFIANGYAQIYAAAGKRREVEELIEKNVAGAGRKFTNLYIAIFYSYLRDKDAAFDYLERALAARESLLVWIGVEPSLDILRDDARYEKLLEKINHPISR